MILKKVNGKKTAQDFLSVPAHVYKNDPNWIPHLKQDVEKVFDPQQNKAFRNGKAERWVAYNDANKPVGCVAAFVNDKYSRGMKFPTGGLGFFDCIEDEALAHKLLDIACDWLKEQGMKAVDGPINFGEKNMFWGLITENYEVSNSYGMNYNPAYYKSFFESFGFEVYYKQFIFHRDMARNAEEVFVRKANMLRQTGEYTSSNVQGWSMDTLAEHFCTVYNNAWGGHHGFKKMPLAQAKKTVAALKPVMDKDIVIFAFHQKKPVGFYVNIPELNDIFKHVHGNLNVIGKLKFLYHKWRKTSNRMVGLVFGVDRDYHGKGVEGLLITHASEHILPLKRYSDTIMTWIGDFNPKMITVVKNLGTEEYRTMCTYRNMLDKSIPFERMPIVG